MILNSPYITGSLTVTGNTTLMGALTVTGSLTGTAATASFALTLGGTGSVGFATTGAFSATSGSASSRLTQIEQVYATTGSNSFRATQSITGSLTVTGQIIAQTLNVQQVTSSIVFSSGSNTFGCDINSRQTFTGSFYQTGSVAIFNSCVGIGTTTPNYLLQVNSNNTAAHIQLTNCTTGNTITDGARLLISNLDVVLNNREAGFIAFETTDTERMRITSTGIACFACQICAPYFRIENSDGIASIIRQTNASSYSSLRLYNDQNSANRALEIDYMGSTYAGGERAEIFVTGEYPLLLGTSNTCRMFISNTGITSFTCQTCSPQFITTQGSSVSYTTGTNYTVWNSENESCIQDSNNPAAYTRIKTWIADRSGCATIRYTGYIQSGPTYWGYRITRNGTSSYMCVAYSDCVQPGCASANVHAYSSYQFNVGPFLPGDCIGLDVVSTGGGATPIAGQGQWIYAKEFRVFSSTPNLSAGTSGNVFGEWVGIGTCTPFSNFYVQGNNGASYDASVDNGQDGCGVTMTVRNNSTVNNSFAQLNMQVSGDSGRAIGRIALIRRDSASSHMAFAIETANTKTEIMRMGCYGASSHNFIMVGRTNAGISAGTGITLNASTGQIESSVTGDDILNLNRNVSDGKIIRLFKNCVEVGSISTNSNSLPSDANFKTNINNLNLGLNLVSKLRPVSYNHKLDDSGSPLSTGFIAQEMQCILDELGVERNSYFILQHKPIEDQRESQYWLDYTKMIPVLTKAIQEQQCTINLLKTCLGIA
jgi:hypothetical protein